VTLRHVFSRYIVVLVRYPLVVVIACLSTVLAADRLPCPAISTGLALISCHARSVEDMLSQSLERIRRQADVIAAATLDPNGS
jgi:hypothetical protein